MIDYQLYHSARGIPLVYCEPPPAKPLLTVENYIKWYSIEVVCPDGQVKAIEDYPGGAALLEEAWCDHNFNPQVCYRMARLLGLEWHVPSLEMVLGRYAAECGQDPFYRGEIGVHA